MGSSPAAKQILSAYDALCPDCCEMRAEAKGLIVSPNPFPKKKLQQHSSRAGIRLFYASVKKNKCDLRKVQELKAYFQTGQGRKRRVTRRSRVPLQLIVSILRSHRLVCRTHVLPALPARTRAPFCHSSQAHLDSPGDILYLCRS